MSNNANGSATAIEALEPMRKRLAQAETIPDVVKCIDGAEAMRVLARKVDLSLDAQNDWAEYKLDAERKAGQMLADMRLNGGDRRSVSHDDQLKVADFGIDYNQSKRWQRISSLDEGAYRDYIAGTRATGEVTEAGLMRLVAKRERNRPQFDSPPIDLIDLGPFNVLYADPPWRYEQVRTDNRAIENHYPTMPLDEICAMKLPVLDDAVVFLWATSPKQAEAHKVIEAWGFDYRTNMVWVKDKIGMGHYVRQQHEQLLIAKRGNMHTPEESARPPSVVYADRGKHSEKPEVFYEIIESMYPNSLYGELFARRRRDGWGSWGNQL